MATNLNTLYKLLQILSSFESITPSKWQKNSFQLETTFLTYQ